MIKRLLLFLLITFFIQFLATTSSVKAQQTDLPGLQYSCLEAEYCRGADNTCSTTHVHRAKITSGDYTTIPSSNNGSYLTECVEFVKDGENTPQTICTTGSDKLDNELFCNGQTGCEFATKLNQEVGYSIIRSPGDGIYLKDTPELSDANSTKGPVKISTDSSGKIVPNIAEWQSYTSKSQTRSFLVWTKVAADESVDIVQDPGQKQATLTFPIFSQMCGGLRWDPQGIVYDAQTGLPIKDALLDIEYSPGIDGPFEKAIAGIDETSVLPPGTENPMQTDSAGFYSFFGKAGYYKITPSAQGYTHLAEDNSTIPSEVFRIYQKKDNYYSSSSPIKEVEGVLKIANIPMVKNMADASAESNEEIVVLSHVVEVSPDGKMTMKGRVNMPAVVSLNACDERSGVPNCRLIEELDPINGGPSLSNGLSYNIIVDQENDLNLGEVFKLSFKPYFDTPESLSKNTNNPENILSKIASIFIGQVNAQENDSSNEVSIDINPIPTYIEGYLYTEEGKVLPNAKVGIYVNFSPAPIYETYTDSKGYVKITSENLPRDQFYIKTENGDGVENTITTARFLAQNEEFMAVEDVSAFAQVYQDKDPRANITPEFQPRNPIISDASEAENSIQKQPEEISNKNTNQNVETNFQKPTDNRLVFFSVIAVLSLVIIVIAVFLYFKKRNNETEN